MPKQIYGNGKVRLCLYISAILAMVFFLVCFIPPAMAEDYSQIRDVPLYADGNVKANWGAAQKTITTSVKQI